MRARRAAPACVAAVLLVGLLVEAGHQIAAGNDAPAYPIIDDWLHDALILASSVICARGAMRRLDPDAISLLDQQGDLHYA